jgi:hypothetical protein
MENNFYCQQKCVPVDFSFEEWNKAYLEIQAMPITEVEKQKLINGEPCVTQCFACMAIVGERRKKTQDLIKKQKDAKG